MRKSGKIPGCDLHDYLELACMYRYLVRVTLKNGVCYTGIAIDIRTLKDNSTKTEVLMLENHQRDVNFDGTVSTHQLQKLEVLTENAKFSEVMF